MGSSMSRLLFENSKFALGFAAVTIVGAGMLMGTENSLSGVELEGESEPAPPPKVVAQTQTKAAPKPLPDQPVIADWASDEELIDTADGFDPSPEEPIEIVDGPAPDAGTSERGDRASAQPKPGGRPAGGPASAGSEPSIPASAKRDGAVDVK